MLVYVKKCTYDRQNYFYGDRPPPLETLGRQKVEVLEPPLN